jgi:hypothetical protein
MNLSNNSMLVAVLVTGFATMPTFAQTPPGGGTSPVLMDRTADQPNRLYGETNRDRSFDWGYLGLLGLAGLMGTRRKRDDRADVRTYDQGQALR